MKKFQGVPDVKFIHLDPKDSVYPLREDVVAEYKGELEAAENIVFEFPVWWYAAPPSMANLISSVFTYGFAYIIDGSEMKAAKLVGKKLYVICSVGGSEEDYKEGSGFGSIIELTRSYQSIAYSCGMKYGGVKYITGCATGKQPMTPETEEKFTKFFEECLKFIE